MPYLIVVNRAHPPDQEPQIVPLTNHFCVGRTEPNDLVLSDLRISRRHIRFENTERGWEVFDNGSTSGLAINDVRVGASQLLKDGDSIQIGGFRLLFRLGEPSR